jgi:hypothetical protein
VSLIDRILRRRSHYRNVFQPGKSTDVVLADLARFARFGSSPVVVATVRQQVDPFATAVQIGRQEMLQRIQHYLHLDDAQLLKLKEQADDE